MERECREIIEMAEGPSVCAPSPEEHAAGGTGYSFKVVASLPYEEALRRLRDALQREGFRMLSEVREGDLCSCGRYAILTVLDPALSPRALDVSRDSGLLLTWNAIVFEQERDSIVEVVNPSALPCFAEDPTLQEIAVEAGRKLRAAVASVVSG